MSGHAQQVVERYLAEVLTGDQETARRRADLERRAPPARGALPDERFRHLEVEVGPVLATDDLVAVHLVGRATHRGLFHGVPPTGRSWEARCTAIYHVVGDRIADAWVNWDLLTLLEQLGALERVQTVSA